MADGVVSDRWSPVSPVTGELDAIRWGVPGGAIGDGAAAAALAAKLEALLGHGARSEAPVDASTPEPVVKQAPSATLHRPDMSDAEAPAKLLPAAAATPMRQQRPAASTSREVAVAAAAPQPRARIEPHKELGSTDAPFTEAPPAGSAAAARTRTRKPVEAKIFVPPRAPDDPGTEASELDDLQSPLPYPTSGAKA